LNTGKKCNPPTLRRRKVPLAERIPPIIPQKNVPSLTGTPTGQSLDRVYRFGIELQSSLNREKRSETFPTDGRGDSGVVVDFRQV